MGINIFLLMATLGGCRKKVTGNEKEIEKKGIEPTPVTSKVRLLEVVPYTVEVGVSTDVTITGSGFKSGASLYLNDGTTPLGNISFHSSSVLEASVPALNPGIYDLRIENPDGATHVLYGALTAQANTTAQTLSEKCKNITFYFETGRSNLSEKGLAVLNDYVSCFSNNYHYRIEGHCDDRGTTEYNISLGHRRANVIQRYLLTKGVLSEKITTVSYGEERPVSNGHSEEHWAKNRRAVILIGD